VGILLTTEEGFLAKNHPGWRKQFGELRDGHKKDARAQLCGTNNWMTGCGQKPRDGLSTTGDGTPKVLEQRVNFDARGRIASGGGGTP